MFLDRRQRSPVREGGEQTLNHEQLVRSALLDAEAQNALRVASVLAIQLATPEELNQAVTDEGLRPEATEAARIVTKGQVTLAA